MKLKIGKFKSRRKFKSQRGLFYKDDGDLSQSTIIIAGLVVAATVTTGGIAVATQQGAKSTAICINNSTSFSQNGNLQEDCRKESEEISDSSEEKIKEIFGSTTTPDLNEEEKEEEILECTYDDSTEAEDRQAIEEVYREQLEILLRLSREETLDHAGFYAEIDQIVDASALQEIYDGTFDQEKLDKAVEVSRKYVGELPPIFIPEEAKVSKQTETLYAVEASLVLYTYASSIKLDFPFVETENVEFVINRDNFLYYGDSAMYSVLDLSRDKSKDVLKIYVNGEELEDYYIANGYSLHYADGITLVGEHFIKEDCSWKYVVSPVRQGDIPM